MSCGSSAATVSSRGKRRCAYRPLPSTPSCSSWRRSSSSTSSSLSSASCSVSASRSRCARKRTWADVRRLYLRRMLWLFLFGVAHAVLIFYGDILIYTRAGPAPHMDGFHEAIERSWMGLAFALLVPVVLRTLLSGLPLLTEGRSIPPRCSRRGGAPQQRSTSPSPTVPTPT